MKFKDFVPEFTLVTVAEEIKAIDYKRKIKGTSQSELNMGFYCSICDEVQSNAYLLCSLGHLHDVNFSYSRGLLILGKDNFSWDHNRELTNKEYRKLVCAHKHRGVKLIFSKYKFPQKSNLPCPTCKENFSVYTKSRRNSRRNDDYSDYVEEWVCPKCGKNVYTETYYGNAFPSI